MSMTKRTQGRPPRNSGVNGREKLIEATRTYLQSNRKMSLTRTEIAQGCGVTPALISYYFKDKKSLLDAVTKPLLRSYRARLGEIIASPARPLHKMRQVIRLLIHLNTEDGFLVDHVLGHAHQTDLDPEDQVTIATFQEAIAGLIRDLVAQGEWRALDPFLAEIALWGLCRAFGEGLRRSGSAELPPEPRAVEERIAFVTAMFQAGIDALPASVPSGT